MKKLLHFFILLCMTTGIASSCKESGLDRSLSQAGNNRKELEAVLRHYQNAPLKLQAARFLIENMDTHYGFGGEAVEEYYHAMDSIFRHGKGDRTYWNRQYDSILAQVGTGLDSCMSVPRHRTYQSRFPDSAYRQRFCRVEPELEPAIQFRHVPTLCPALPDRA